MRKSEITPELIDLSKRAKELGFPQAIEEGDFGNIEDTNGKFFITLLTEDYMNCPKLENNDFLIPSFSRCLEWLRERGYQIELRHYGAECWYLFELIENDTEKQEDVTVDEQEGETHHEAIAKAVCKILSEGQEVKVLEGEQ